MAHDSVSPFNKEEVLQKAQGVFFEAMLDGYAGGKSQKSTKSVSNSGHKKTIRFTSGDFTVVDEWETTPHSDYSVGTTRIYHCGILIWWMSYGGHYKKEAIPLLKQSLKEAYEMKEFLGGRGVSPRLQSPFEYYNSFSGDFKRFEGIEGILNLGVVDPENLDPAIVGYHQYFGMALI